MSPYLSFETCYEVHIMQLYSYSIRKYNISMLSRLGDSVHQFLECGLIFAPCKRNYVFSQKKLSSLFLIGSISFRPLYHWKLVCQTNDSNVYQNLDREQLSNIA